MTNDARVYNEVKTVYLINDIWKTVPTMQKLETRPFLEQYTRINSK